MTPGPVKPTYAYKWTARRNNAVVLKEGKLDLSSGEDKIEIAGDQPEMIYVAVEPYASLSPDTAAPAYVGGNTGRNNGLYAVGAAVTPAKIGLSTPRPEDFDTFWDGKLAQQAKVPINPLLTKVETDVPGVELSMFVLDALGSQTHGYLAKPAGEGKFPALIQLQYAGVYALNARGAAQRAAEGWLFINVDSHDKLPSDPAGTVPRSYQSVGNTDREKSYFLNMYLRDSRALDYLVNTARTGTAKPSCLRVVAWEGNRVSCWRDCDPGRSLRLWSACPPARIPTAIFTAAKPAIPTGRPTTRT